MWGVAAHLTGVRVKVRIHEGWLGANGLDTWAYRKNGHRPEHKPFTESVLAVVVTNVGRVPVTITKCAMALDGWQLSALAASHTDLPASWDPDLPHRIEVGESYAWCVDRWEWTLEQGWYVDPRQRSASAQQGILIAKVHFGDGRTRSHSIPFWG